MTRPRRKKYLNNADLLREIQKSKMTYCSVIDPIYNMYDFIVFDESEIDEEILQKAKTARIKRLNNEILENTRNVLNCGTKKAREHCIEQDLFLKDVPDDEVVIRVITNEHIPEGTRTNFEAFKQYIISTDGELIEVARSHWKGDFETGEFIVNGGKLTNELGKMFIKLVEEISHKANFRNYTYLDEMQGEARIQLVKNALLFKESMLYKKDKPTNQLNPFSYYTSFVTNSFRSVLNSEKTVRNIRDDLLEINGFTPSHTRQLEIEVQMIERKKEEEQEQEEEKNIDENRHFI
ncbi:RNA polymerase late transcription sigma factor [Klebsiella phage Muenster]|nr:RNA polymerase late transcription sigma factor [Klebsiella phage Muenster]